MPMCLVTTMTCLLFTHELTKEKRTETENKAVGEAELGCYARLHPVHSLAPKNNKSSGILLLVLQKEALMDILSPFVSLSRFHLMDSETQRQQFKSQRRNRIKDVIRK